MRSKKASFPAAILCAALAICLLSGPAISTAQFEQQPPPPGSNVPRPREVLRLKRYVINDDQGFQIPLFRGLLPLGWTVQGGVTWNPNLGPPDHIRVHWADAQGLCACDIYPYIRFYWAAASSPFAARFNVPGQVRGGAIAMEPPKDQFDAIDKVIIQKFRPDLAQARVVNQQRLPEVAKKLFAQYQQIFGRQWYVLVMAGRETFEYEVNGQTVQEDVFLVYDGTKFLPSGVINWEINYAGSERAPKDRFGKFQRLSTIISKSIQMNPQWTHKLNELIAQRQAAARQQQQEQYDAIEARIRAQEEANDEQHQSYWDHSDDLHRQDENYADYQREVSPWKDDEGNTYKLPIDYSYAWEGADGEVIMSNDAGYRPQDDPNLNPTQWSSMQPTHN
jgi:hypothetical protein